MRLLALHGAVTRQPKVALWLVGREGVGGRMDVPLRTVGGDPVHGARERDAPPPFAAAPRRRAGRGLQGGNQRRRAMPLGGRPLCPPSGPLEAALGGQWPGPDAERQSVMDGFSSADGTTALSGGAMHRPAAAGEPLGSTSAALAANSGPRLSRQGLRPDRSIVCARKASAAAPPRRVWPPHLSASAPRTSWSGPAPQAPLPGRQRDRSRARDRLHPELEARLPVRDSGY